MVAVADVVDGRRLVDERVEEGEVGADIAVGTGCEKVEEADEAEMGGKAAAVTMDEVGRWLNTETGRCCSLLLAYEEGAISGMLVWVAEVEEDTTGTEE